MDNNRRLSPRSVDKQLSGPTPWYYTRQAITKARASYAACEARHRKEMAALKEEA